MYVYCVYPAILKCPKQLANFTEITRNKHGSNHFQGCSLSRLHFSLEQYWCGTLRVLYLNDNHLEEINESVLKLGKQFEYTDFCTEIVYLINIIC
jgi:hypothetical protein